MTKSKTNQESWWSFSIDYPTHPVLNRPCGKQEYVLYGNAHEAKILYGLLNDRCRGGVFYDYKQLEIDTEDWHEQPGIDIDTFVEHEFGIELTDEHKCGFKNVASAMQSIIGRWGTSWMPLSYGDIDCADVAALEKLAMTGENVTDLQESYKKLAEAEKVLREHWSDFFKRMEVNGIEITTEGPLHRRERVLNNNQADASSD